MKKDPFHIAYLESSVNQGQPTKSKDFDMKNYAYYLSKHITDADLL